MTDINLGVGSEETYSTDIEMVMDFLKLSIIFDKPKASNDNLAAILTLQKAIIELLPVAQSNRMSTIYAMMANIYRTNKRELEQRRIR